MRIKLQKYFEGIDWVFLTLVMVIIFFGLIMLTSASAPVGYDKFYDSYHYIKHQLIFGFIPGLIGMFIFLQVPYERLRRYAFPLLVVSVVLLIMVFIPGLGSEYGTAKSWIVIGGFSLQPSEIVKLTFLFYLAAWLEARGREGVSDFSKGLVPFLSVLGVIMLLIVLQPDIGTMSIIVATSLVVYFIAGAPLLYLSGIGAAGIGFLFMLISFAPYRAARFMTFLHPELDPQGIGYHINQALLAIGSGGLFGLGYGHSRQKFQYLPEVSGDSIFAVVAEELGFFLAVAVVILFVYLFIRGLKIASNAPDMFGKLIVVGVVSWIMIQVFFNIGSMIGLMPMTGVPLPFISLGGTSMMVLMSAIGVVLNISRASRKYG